MNATFNRSGRLAAKHNRPDKRLDPHDVDCVTLEEGYGA